MTGPHVGWRRHGPGLPCGLWSTGRAVLCAAVALLLALVPEPLLGQEYEDDSVEVTDVRFEGDLLFDKALLRDAIVTQATRCRVPVPFSGCIFGLMRDERYFDEAALRADLFRLRLFYFQRGYRSATIETDTIRNDRGIEVVFRIDPGEPVRITSVDVLGGEGLLPDGFARRLPVQVGQPFHLIAYEAARDSLIGMLKNEGYPRADVLAGYTISSGPGSTATVQYEIIPGTQARFGEIVITGNERIESSVIERMLSFRTGDLYRQDEIQRSQSNLFGLDVFRYAVVQPQMDSRQDSVIPVTVQVVEGNLHRIRLGAGINQGDCVNAEGRWTSHNFLGGARRLEIRGGISNVLAKQIENFPCNETGGERYDDLAGNLAADFTQPWFLGLRNTLGTGIFIERRSVPEVFVRNARGGYLSISRALGGRTSVALGYRPELTWLDAESDLYFCTNLVACEEKDIQVLTEPHWLAPLTLSLLRDRSNSLFSPTRGYILRLEAEQAAGVLGSDFAYTRLVGDLSWYHGLSDGVVLATRLRPGWARPQNEPGEVGTLGLNPQRRFFAGGPNSVRGYAQFRLGPKVLRVDGARLIMPVDSGGAGCTVESVNDGSCSAAPIAADHFEPRPVGGEAVLEGSVELRFPVAGEKWRGAAFVDFGQVWRTHDAIRLDEIEFTPGVGIRYFSPIGPIRVDVGYNMQGVELLPVITNQLDPADPTGRSGDLLKLNQDIRWNPRGSIIDRLQIHFSIGQAF